MQFSLFPWDRNRPRRNFPLADCVVEHDGKTFGLRAQNGIMFFRDQNEPSKTWAIATPIPLEIENDKTQFESFFGREFERGNVARYVVHFASGLDRTLPLFFKSDGTGFCREGWNRDDIPFTHTVSMHDFLEGADEVVRANLGNIKAQLWAQLEQMPFPSETNKVDDEDRIEWLCGSKDELERIAGWICTLETGLWKPGVDHVEISTSTESQFERAHVSTVEAHARDGFAGHGIHMHIDVESFSDELTTWGGEHEIALSSRFWRLFDLALNQNTPTGLYWEYHDYGQNRTADSPHAPTLTFEFARPTIEDRADARAELRRWMAPLVPLRELEDILSDDTPRDLPKHEW